MILDASPGGLPRSSRAGRRTSLDAMRRRMIEETELALYVGLQMPQRSVRIPTIQCGCGEFDADFAARFWQEVLSLGDDFDRCDFNR